MYAVLECPVHPYLQRLEESERVAKSEETASTAISGQPFADRKHVLVFPT